MSVSFNSARSSRVADSAAIGFLPPGGSGQNDERFNEATARLDAEICSAFGLPARLPGVGHGVVLPVVYPDFSRDAKSLEQRKINRKSCVDISVPSLSSSQALVADGPLCAQS